jgi:hypothetical protein
MKPILMTIIALLLIGSGQAISVSLSSGGGSISQAFVVPESASLRGELTAGDGQISASTKLGGPGVLTAGGLTAYTNQPGTQTEVLSDGTNTQISMDGQVLAWETPKMQYGTQYFLPDGNWQGAGPTAGGLATDYKLNGKKWKRDAPIKQTIDMTGSPLDSMTMYLGVKAAGSLWDDQTSKNLFDDSGPNFGTGTYGSYDGKNLVKWVYNPASGALATTGTFYVTSTGEIKEFDTVYNSKHIWDGNWFLRTATHEAGHGLGMADIYVSGNPVTGRPCPNVMNSWNAGSSFDGLLGLGDATGIRAIYGA